jgi:catechol 2,3-dioxygenase-like lactoylglutathione lyase family enzyme
MRSRALVDRGRVADAVPPHRSTGTRTNASRDDRIVVAGVDYLSIFTPDLRRSVDLYSQVFGFSVVESVRRGAGRSMLMAARRFHVAIHERQRDGSEPERALRWRFVVDDLDRARASVWDLGLVPIRDGAHEPRRDRRGLPSRSFVIRDPGGNEIEVVERVGIVGIVRRV